MMYNNPYYQNLLYQNMLINAYNNHNYFYQGNIPSQLYYCPNYQNIYFKPQTNYCNFQKNNKFNEKIPINENKRNKEEIEIKQMKEIKEEKEENIFEKINNIKMNRRRRSSIDTTICDSSFNSNLSDNEKVEEEKEKEEKKETSKKIILINPPNTVLDLKRRLSNISEANSESSQCNNTSDNDDDLSDSFFSDEEIDDKENEKNTNNINNQATNSSLNAIKNKPENESKFEQYKGNPMFENTEILRVYVKISKDKIAVFKLKRYDDVFETIKLFCEINSVDEKLIKPLIIKSLSALNTIYQIMNCKLDDKKIKLLKKLKNM